MVSTKVMVVLACLLISAMAEDTSIDGGYEYDYGKHRPAIEKYPQRRYPSYVKYYTRKHKPRKPVIVDGLPLYRD
ncbi:hypothetical protein JTE90_000588 [Oedothorax gibbosus]|uniref:Uncharacterized protein n=1 Tax=Oedothorax gibbosus TaxID=931172 RepID=A0AAV6VWS7_9ARAC|nr:hypothetical protein JTE90_000588 [Oedothorax gibbosus]